jgi:serine/threonine protein kinase
VDSNLPQVFGRYLLVQRLSRGGMGEIFLAKHGLAGFEKLAVIKKVLPHLAADQQFISRFVDEAQVAIKLQHVNVAQVFEVGRVGDEYFLAIEYVEGRDLRRTLTLLTQKKQRFPVDLALYVARELANGLAYAHRRTDNDGASLNLVHCDISPPNVVVSFEGETKVIDFGIAKSALRATASDPKMGFGKFGYMAPEQLIRGGNVDHRTDIYAAGVVLFELLTGQRLYESGPEPDYRALARKVAKGDHKLPSEIDPLLAPYDDLVASALQPQAADRYQSAAEFRDAIQHALVAVNPTISTDQLGAFMRVLFTEEMTAQRELHERVAKAHLADFQEQLTTQTSTTVSFAFANLPLPPPPDPAKPPKLPSSRRSGQNAAIAGRSPTIPPALPPARSTTTPPPRPAASSPAMPAAPAAAPAELQLSTEELALADGTGTIEPTPRTSERKGVVVGAIAGLAIVACIGVIVAFAMSGGDNKTKQASAAIGSSTGGGSATMTVQSIDPVAAPPPAPPPPAPPVNPPVDPKDVAVDPPQPPPPAPPPAPPPEPKKHDRTRSPKRTFDKAHTDKAHVDHPAKPAVTREAVGARFSQVSRAYEAYKAKNGGRLDGEWGDLVTFVQFRLTADNLDDAIHRIDAFAAKLRE